MVYAPQGSDVRISTEQIWSALCFKRNELRLLTEYFESKMEGEVIDGWTDLERNGKARCDSCF